MTNPQLQKVIKLFLEKIQDLKSSSKDQVDDAKSEISELEEELNP